MIHDPPQPEVRICAFHGLRRVAIAVGRSTKAAARSCALFRHSFRHSLARTACNKRVAWSHSDSFARAGLPPASTSTSPAPRARTISPPSRIWRSCSIVVAHERMTSAHTSRSSTPTRRSCSVDSVTASPVGKRTVGGATVGGSKTAQSISLGKAGTLSANDACALAERRACFGEGV